MRPLHPSRVSAREGKFFYVESYDVIARLNMIFGFDGWDKRIKQLDVIFEDETDKGWTVAYRCVMQLMIGGNNDNPDVKWSEDVATGVANNQRGRADAHDLASKSAVSDALKRCAKDLGDQFGLCLYNKGSLEPTATSSAVYDITDEAESNGKVEHVPLSEVEDAEPIITKPQMAKIQAICKEIHRDPKVVASEALGRQIMSLQILSKSEASTVIDYLGELNNPSPDESFALEQEHQLENEPF
jgi:DNA recombination protein Rad52